MTGIFFGSTMGTTEAVAADIAKQLGVADADVHNVADKPAGEVQKYDLLVLGSSTWGAGELQDDWYGFLAQLKAQDLSGKKVALFGCGDLSARGLRHRTAAHRPAYQRAFGAGRQRPY
mgnify:CR=1 FL=1